MNHLLVLTNLLDNLADTLLVADVALDWHKAASAFWRVRLGSVLQRLETPADNVHFRSIGSERLTCHQSDTSAAAWYSIRL